MKIKKGDKVRVVAGKNNGQEGVVERVYVKQETVVVPGINMYKRHMKRDPQTGQGGIIEIPRAMQISNVMLICPKCGKPTRVGYKIEKSKKYRICKKCEKLF
ncbi:50S ribosomal protein L24 [Candidatus Microgenomates bacterium]|nr:50S ribosomal protein L24 [Candidatus Microgenomates bacterium]